MNKILRFTIFALALSITTSTYAQHDHEDIIVGVDSGGKIQVEFDHFGEEHELPPVTGLINGWLGDHPGFAHLEEDEPAEDFFMLASGAQIHFEVVLFEEAFQAWGPGFTGPYAEPGDVMFLGDHQLHEHMTWHINSDDPLFDAGDTPWNAQFRLVDTGTTNYAPSDTYTLMFTPEPTTASLLLIGGLMLCRRRP